MRASSHCAAMIKKFSGLATGAYFKNGCYIIGYGRRHVSKDLKITPLDAERYLEYDLSNLSVELEKALAKSSITVNQNQFDALCDLAYCVGLAQIKASPLWRAMQRGNFGIAANYFMLWNTEPTYDGIQVRRSYLVNRRKAEQKLFLEN